MLLVTLLGAMLLMGASGSNQFRVDYLINMWKNQLNSTFNVNGVNATTMELRGMHHSPSGTTGLGYSALGHVNLASTNDPDKD
ncbi:unnamed protein product [Adineta steineri]|uniref:Uncharacterized protein n=1 Tax=Adineta steineri TaxID=433720 RepID=A0A815RAN0_9BILA|nr:unnamed protein product [Adineta steineri]CAF3839070.1 unnamed protein product [Adineta steineri]